MNWDPVLHTALSDLEVVSEPEQGSLWHLRYPIEDGSGHVVVATTRPETMLGDVAVAVNPEDERYRHLIGRNVRLPITGRLVPIIGDDYADPAFGSGCVKITPAHDFNDYEIARRHGLPLINVLTADAALNDEVPEGWRGLDRFDARKRVVAEFEALGLLDKVEPHTLPVPRGDRSGAVLEPWLTDQWYVRIAPLAEPAIKAVEDGRIRFVPDNWAKTYFQWMRNIQDWCISRQLWWGHRIPAWYDADGNVYVAPSEADAVEQARARHGRDVVLTRDEDVLDTWFSSALWPFSTLGWPEHTAEVRSFYPSTVLVTGFDIIFFWVARMMMMGLHVTGEVPFKTVFINALVRDAKGAKMSKSKGNVMDPLELVDKYGADALRFTLTAMSGQGRDIKLDEQRIEGYRNFGTKLWNAARFCQMNECLRDPAFTPDDVKQTVNRWIRSEALKTTRQVTAALEACAFDEAAVCLYRFIWNVFCDWYLELAKPILNGDDEAAKAETRATAAWTLDVAMKLLHPVMPFLTEELWDKTAEFGPKPDGLLISARWPDLPDSYADATAAEEIELVIDSVAEGRSLRSDLNVPPSAKPSLFVIEASPAQRKVFAANAASISQTLRVAGIKFEASAPQGAVTFVVAGATLALPVAEFVNFENERTRLTKELDGLAADIDRTAKKLGNPDFVARAKEEVVEETRAKLAEAESAKVKLEAALVRLAALS